MRPHIAEFVKMVVNTIPVTGPVYEFGSYQVQGQEDIADMRPLFTGFQFVGTDARPGPGVDEVQNLHALDILDNSVGTALCLETLEHVKLPWQAAHELYRVLRPGGILIATSTMNYPIHDHPDDYWRYTPSGFDSLFWMFNDRFIGYAGDDTFPHTVVVVARKCIQIQPNIAIESMLDGKYHDWKLDAEFQPAPRKLSDKINWALYQSVPPFVAKPVKRIIRKAKEMAKT